MNRTRPTYYTIKLARSSPARVWITRAKYSNGRTALRLDCEGGVFTKATVNLPNVPMAPDEVAIKDYAEGEGMLQFLIDNNMVEQPHRYERSGHVVIPICRLKGQGELAP